MNTDRYTVVHSSNAVEVLEDYGVIGESKHFYVDAKLIRNKGFEMFSISMHDKSNDRRCKYISLFPDQVIELRKILNGLVIEKTAR